MVKRRIPAVEVGPMEVDTGTYPSLGQDDTAPGPEKRSTAAGRRGRRPAEPAASAPAASETSPSSPPRPAGRNDGGERQSALIAAAVAGVLAVVALAVAWTGRSDGSQLQAALDAADARVTAQVAELRQAGHDSVNAVAMLLESEQEERRSLAASLALLRLGAKARSDGPFLDELRLAVDLAADDPAARGHLAALARSAEQGLPPRALLQAGFTQAVLQPARPTSTAALFTSITGSISGLFDRVLPNGSDDGPAPDALLEDLLHAESALLAGDLESAVAAVRPHGEALPHARQWVAVAERRLEAERALTSLDALVGETLSRFR